MDNELLKSLKVSDEAALVTVEHVQNCIAVYEQTLRAMGICAPDTVSQAVDSSQLQYAEYQGEEAYADISDSY